MAYNFDYRDPPEFYQEVVHLAMCGLSLKEIGCYYSVDDESWQEFCTDHPLVAEKVETGKAKGKALAAQELIKQIKGGKINAIMFYLKTMGGFNEKTVMQLEELKITHMPPPPIPSDPVEASKTYANFMKGS